jgi:hypothetical protein
MRAAWQDKCCKMRARRPPVVTVTGCAKPQHAATSDDRLQGSAGRVQLVLATECNPQQPRCNPVSPVARCSVCIYAITNSDQLHQRDADAYHDMQAVRGGIHLPFRLQDVRGSCGHFAACGVLHGKHGSELHRPC